MLAKLLAKCFGKRQSLNSKIADRENPSMPQAGCDVASYDIAIIGGGMVGASLALALRQALPSGTRLAVLEAVDHEPDTQNWQPSL